MLNETFYEPKIARVEELLTTLTPASWAHEYWSHTRQKLLSNQQRCIQNNGAIILPVPSKRIESTSDE
jgi:hypothetical protein|tara:strand:+ start:2755 stop:2958 length:204 start_codon:yes stop_codon:yes gene_type:complete